MVVTAHGYDATLCKSAQMKVPDGRFFKLNERSMVKAAARILCVSDFIRRELLSKGYPEEKLTVVRLGLDLERFKRHSVPPVSARSGMLFAGRLVEKKGLALLLQACARLPTICRGETLRVIGDGPLRAEMESLAERLAVRAEFLGAQPRDEVIRLMRRSRVFAFPSTRAANGDAEGMGIVAMEAQALGLPVIAFDEGPGREVIDDDRSGLLARRGDIDDFARQLGRVLQDDRLAERLSAGGPPNVRMRFDLAKTTEQLEAIYDDVIAASAA